MNGSGRPGVPSQGVMIQARTLIGTAAAAHTPRIRRSEYCAA